MTAGLKASDEDGADDRCLPAGQALGGDAAGQGQGHRARAAGARLLWSLGGRYRLHRKDLPGKPDIVLPGRRLAVFVHGCFWHGHDCARGARVPKANRDYWLGKVARNRARDIAARTGLEAAGWRVETVWECELKDKPALEARARGWLGG